MTQIVPVIAMRQAPALVADPGERATFWFLEPFIAQIGNPNTRRAYAKAVSEFCAWLDSRGLSVITAVSPIHISAYVEELGRTHSALTVKQRLAAIRKLFDGLATGGVLPFNPATGVQGPKHVIERGKTPVLAPDEARALIDCIDVTTPIGLRDRALIGLMIYAFARIGAATAMKVEDVFAQNRRLWVRLRVRGGKAIDLPCHHNLEIYLRAYRDGAGIAGDGDGPLFRTIGRGTGILTRTPLPAANANDMVKRRAKTAGIGTRVSTHTFRATGITAYLTNGGTLEKAAAIANHASTRTTQCYDLRSEEASLDDIERISI